ncbi:MAG: polyprenyl synthetase family protein [Bifidobacteriaceae bacterium]|jgi:geranylgeranyl diphosphate synthase type I|nr:polyprenyl synthetase family protein [Bifidobacteriaceae bacterium]
MESDKIHQIKQFIKQVLLQNNYFQKNQKICQIIIDGFENASFRRAQIICSNNSGNNSSDNNSQTNSQADSKADSKADSDIALAAALEIFHNAALIQDDIIDNAKTRRWMKSVPEILGKNKSLLLGNILYGLAKETFVNSVNKLDKSYWLKNSKSQLLNFWNKVFLQVQIGQLLDIQLENAKLELNNYKTLTDLIYQVTLNKTVSYSFIFPNYIKAVLDKTQFSDEIKNQAIQKGLDFQNLDDIANIVQTSQQTGKPELSDIFSKKKTNILIKALEKMPESDAKKIIKLYNNKAKISQARAKYIKTKIGQFI